MKIWNEFTYPGLETPDEITNAIIWENIRLERDRRLAASDWTQLPDAPADAAAWAEYRAALRSLPQTYSDPKDAEWPESPTV